jgi:hypothetical protein
MTARVRKAIGGIAIIAILFAWAWAAATIGGLLPNWQLLRLAYYAVAGIGWSAPVIPLIVWMNRGR